MKGRTCVASANDSSLQRPSGRGVDGHNGQDHDVQALMLRAATLPGAVLVAPPPSRKEGHTRMDHVHDGRRTFRPRSRSRALGLNHCVREHVARNGRRAPSLEQSLCVASKPTVSSRIRVTCCRPGSPRAWRACCTSRP